MNSMDLKSFLLMSSGYLPTLVVSLVGVVILTKWRRAISGSRWALLGFGLALVLCLVMPIVQTILQQWMLRSLHSSEHLSVMRAYSAFAMTGSVLQAVIYVFLLVAVFAGRSKPHTAIPPSLNRA